MEPELRRIARRLVAPGKGILAADESTATIGKRLGKYSIENTEENRRKYRELFLTAPEIGKFLSGCILFKETLYQSTTDGKPFVSVLGEAGILVGIKVDEGLEPLANYDEESHTKGLEHLEENCQKYARQGASFSKWRAALGITAESPSPEAIETNAEELATYASISQRCGLVPIVEPEILIGGNHGIERSEKVAEIVLRSVVQKLKEKSIDLEACLLKIQMVMPGDEAVPAEPQVIATATVNVLAGCIPETLAGIVFLSGGQSEEEATINLNLIVRSARSRDCLKWGLSFSYGRSLQASVLELWSKSNMSKEGKVMAKAMAVAVAEANASATQGQYEGPHPSITSGALTETFRGWNKERDIQDLVEGA